MRNRRIRNSGWRKFSCVITSITQNLRYRNAFGDNQAEQEEVIGKILFLIEKHWNEVFCFSRRSQYNMNRWSARYGYEKTGQEILKKAKCSDHGRYSAVNLCNYSTIEFRLFRGTLKYNTLIATLQFVDTICDVKHLSG